MEEKFKEFFYLHSALKKFGKELSKALLSKGLLRFFQGSDC